MQIVTSNREQEISRESNSMPINESPKSAQDTLSTNNTIKNDISDLEDATMESIAVNTADNAQDPEWIQEQYNKQSNAFPKQMKLVADNMLAHMQRTEWESRMERAFEEQPQMQSSLLSIVKKFEADVPDTESGHMTSHPYLANHPITVQGWKNITIPQYRITREIYADIDFLKRALRTDGIQHGQRVVIQELLAALERYAEHDVGRLAKELITKKQTNSYTSRVINKMGRITLGLGFGAATLAAGVIGAFHMYTKGKDATGSEMFPALGLAGLTIFLANPSLAKSLIGDRYEGALNELSKSVQKPAFKSAAKKYDLHGQPGENIAAVMRTKDDTLYGLVEKCAAGTATTEDINILTAQIVTTKEPIDEQNIRSFLGDPQAVAAISLIRQTHDPDAIDVENDFLRLGMGKFYRKAKDMEAKAMYGNNNDTMTA